jgi:hypothetical protein
MTQDAVQLQAAVSLIVGDDDTRVQTANATLTWWADNPEMVGVAVDQHDADLGRELRFPLRQIIGLEDNGPDSRHTVTRGHTNLGPTSIGVLVWDLVALRARIDHAWDGRRRRLDAESGGPVLELRGKESTVSGPVEAHLLTAEGRHWIPVSLEYRAEAPLQVTLKFAHRGGQTEWRVSRSFLVDGGGDSDVVVTRTARVVQLTLTSPTGRAEFRLNVRHVDRLLRESYDLVPEEREGHYLDVAIEDLIVGILNPTTQ